jgi:hypothetical protein
VQQTFNQEPLCIKFINENSGWAAGVSGKIWHTTDSGANWSEQNSNSNVDLLSLCFVDSINGWICGSGPSGDVILKTSNGGQTWLSYIPDSSYGLKSIYFPNKNTGWAVGYSGKIYKTINGGDSWELSTSPVPGTLNSVFFHDSFNGWIVGLEEITAFPFLMKTSDGGTTWISEKLISYHQPNEILFADGNNGWIVGFGGMILKIEDAGIILSAPAIHNEPIVSFLLSQNFPNPFNPTTKIKYELPERSFVTIKIYDVLGNEKATLVNDEKPVGVYEIEFDAANLPSGVYFYQLRAGQFIETKKMILIK